jgi:hypothetical protein
MFEAMLRAAEIIGQLLKADEKQDSASVATHRAVWHETQRASRTAH